jgi:hypothetical protein
MRYLGLALFAEGPTDYRFLPPVLRRATEDLCLRLARSTIEVQEVLGLYAPNDYRDCVEINSSYRKRQSVNFMHNS